MDKAVFWLTHTRIFNNDVNREDFGSFSAGYDLRKKVYCFAYCEITGYALQFCINISKWMNAPQYIEIARKAGDFLLRAQLYTKNSECTGAIPHGYTFKKGWHDSCYSFDTAVCASALIGIYNLTENEKYLEAALSAGRWVIKTQNDQGSFNALCSVREQKFLPMHSWDGDNGCLHAKNAIALLKIYELTGDPSYLSGAKKVLDWVLGLQNKGGAFKSSIDLDFVFTHSHCYAVEGLLYGYHVLNERKYLDAAVKAGDWLIRLQNKDGSLFRSYGNFEILRGRVTDATSQAVRIWITLYHLMKDKKYINASERAVSFIVDMQNLDKGCAEGGFYYQRYLLMNYRKNSHMMYTWPAMFAIHALYLWVHRQRENLLMKIWDELF